MYSLFTAVALAALFSITLAIQPDQITGFNITWSETFTGPINTSVWEFWPATPSNGEVETYPTSGSNCNITSSQTLLITPLNTNGQWTSCRIETLGAWAAAPGAKLRVQAELKLGTPGALLQGIWPAFWSLGVGVRDGRNIPWPQCGEIDTFENINGQTLGYGTIHCGTECADPTGLSQKVTFDYGAWHTWAHVVDLTSSDWTKQSITFLLDGNQYQEVTGAQIGNQTMWETLVGDMFITLNVAVGGNWAGPVASTTVSGAAAGMEVRYVAVYNSL